MMQFGLTREVIDQMVSVFASFRQVDKVIIYGSRASGLYRYNSDIDLTIFGRDLDLEIQLRLDNALDDLLLPYSIDLSLWEDIENADLRRHIVKVGQCFYTREQQTESLPISG